MTDLNVNGTETGSDSGAAEAAEVAAVDLFSDDFSLDSLGGMDEATSEQPAEEAPAEEAGNVTEEVGPEVSDIPEHLQGKTQAELVQMVRDMESIKGRQGNELGTLRQQVSELQQFANAHLNRTLDSDDVTSSDFDRDIGDDGLDVNKAVENHPLVKKLAEDAAKRQADAALVAAKEIDPQFESTKADPGFANWLQSNPAFLAVAQQANAQNDASSAAQLTKLYSEQTAAAKAQAQAETSTRKDAVESIKGATPTTGAGKPAPHFKASDLRRLYKANPTRYNQILPHVEKAYQEGRVIND